MDAQEGSDAVPRNLPEAPTDSSSHRTWRAWGEHLRRHHLDGFATVLLDAMGPFALISSQLLHFSRPFLGERATHLALLLESEAETQAFRDYLNRDRAETGLDEEAVP